MTAKKIETYLAQSRGERPVQPEQQPTPLLPAFVGQVNEWRLMPEAWSQGLVATWSSTLARGGFLLGERGLFGWWSYFPLSMLFKLPTATLIAALVAAGVFIATIVRHRLKGAVVQSGARLSRWDLACLTVPAAVYGLMALTSHTNVGIRHILPAVPFLYIGISIALSRVRGRLAWPGLGGLAAVLMLETLLAYPNYIAFFNAPSGGSRGGLHLLSDSSLDWGQDLKLLAEWQRANPNVRLHLCYFGSAEPGYYGIRYLPMPDGYPKTLAAARRLEPGALAIGATHLQGQYLVFPPQDPIAKFPSQEPFEVLGGTIYLYEWPPPGQLADRIT